MGIYLEKYTAKETILDQPLDKSNKILMVWTNIIWYNSSPYKLKIALLVKLKIALNSQAKNSSE
jgi:hypothetical protein